MLGNPKPPPPFVILSKRESITTSPKTTIETRHGRLPFRVWTNISEPNMNTGKVTAKIVSPLFSYRSRQWLSWYRHRPTSYGTNIRVLNPARIPQERVRIANHLRYWWKVRIGCRVSLFRSRLFINNEYHTDDEKCTGEEP